MNIELIPINTKEDILEVKAGDWVYDKSQVERYAPGRSLNRNNVIEPIGFARVVINDYNPNLMWQSSKIFLLDTIDGSYWYDFESNRYYKVVFENTINRKGE